MIGGDAAATNPATTTQQRRKRRHDGSSIRRACRARGGCPDALEARFDLEAAEHLRVKHLEGDAAPDVEVLGPMHLALPARANG